MALCRASGIYLHRQTTKIGMKQPGVSNAGLFLGLQFLGFVASCAYGAYHGVAEGAVFEVFADVAGAVGEGGRGGFVDDVDER